MRRLLWILVIALATVLVLLVLRHSDAALEELTQLDHSSLDTKIMALVLIAMAVAVAFRQRFTRVLEPVLIWTAIVLVLAIGYAYRFELREVADRVLVELVPGHVGSHGRTVEIARAGGGGFSIATQVNGARVMMALDTGATAVVLTHDAAKAAGLPIEVLNYSVNVETANGRARAAPVTLDRIAIGGITERSVPALIAQPGQLRTNLLGMSFLNRLESWEVRGDKLLLRGYP